MKFEIFNGYIKFYMSTTEDKTFVQENIITQPLVKVYDYWTVESLSKLKRQYLIGEKILGIQDVTKNIETTPDRMERIFIDLNLYYNFYDNTFIDKKNLVDVNILNKDGFLTSIPLTGSNNPFIKGEIKNYKIYLYA